MAKKTTLSRFLIKIIRDVDIVSNLSTLDAILKIGSKKVRVIRLTFEDKEANRRGDNFRFEVSNPKYPLTKTETEELNKFVRRMNW